jgi:16S rRNA (uracil1498-N3)-methyltransferase
MTRVLIDDAGVAAEAGSRVRLDERRSHHLARVLRLRAGTELEAFDGAGHCFAATLAEAHPQRSVLLLGEPLPAQPESPLAITLAQCLSSAERMDWTIEKAVELGARSLAPLASERSQVRLDAARAARRHEHWLRIVESACVQSGRAWLPTLAPVMPFADFVASAPADRRLVLAPGAATPLSAAGIASGDTVVLLAGPESGFSEAELAHAIAGGFQPVSLGPRTLRTETAGLAAIAALQSLAGDA